MMTEEHSRGTAPNAEELQAESSEETSQGPLEAVNGSSGAHEAAGRGSEVKILVVDDSATIRRSAETMLKSAGFDVITAENGFEALSKVARHNPKLIFVDIMMPRLDGYQTCAIIKNNEQFRSTPVIMLTSKDGLFDQARGRVVGSDLYLTKPFTKEELLGAVQQHAVS
jgi:twitching motility two-component system response regulator PilG